MDSYNLSDTECHVSYPCPAPANLELEMPIRCTSSAGCVTQLLPPQQWVLEANLRVMGWPDLTGGASDSSTSVCAHKEKVLALLLLLKSQFASKISWQWYITIAREFSSYFFSQCFKIEKVRKVATFRRLALSPFLTAKAIVISQWCSKYHPLFLFKMSPARFCAGWQSDLSCFIPSPSPLPL
jgi:hypothetical protein